MAFSRPLPRPALFTWALWVAVCGLAYWNYVQAAGERMSLVLSVAFGGLVFVVVPLVVLRTRERLGGLIAAILSLLGYVLLMQGAGG